MSPADVAELVLLLTAAYPDHNLPQATTMVYEKFLQDLDLEEAKIVIVNHVATRKWFPKISEIREAALELTLGIDSTETVMEQLQGDPQKISPLAKKALKLTGGLWEMNRTTNPSAWRSQFRKAYESMREAALIEKRQEATHGLLAQLQPKQQLEDDNNARPARLTRGDSPKNFDFCNRCFKRHEASADCPRT